MTGEDLARAAATLIGVPFRLHGRDPQTGLDCIGVLACALEQAGRPATLPCEYSLRSRAVPAFGQIARIAGFLPATGQLETGDVLIVRPGPCQHHLLITLGRDTCVHAHLGLKRVVSGPMRRDWPTLGRWRIAAPTQES